MRGCSYFLLFFSIALVLPNNGKPAKVVAFDCHGVLFERKPWNVCNQLLKFLGKNYHLVPLSLFVAPCLVYKWIRGMNLQVDAIIKEIPFLEKYRDDIYTFVRLDGLIQKMISIIKKLRQQGVVIVLASNIHEDALAYNKAVMPEFFSFFDYTFTCSESKGLTKQSKDYFVALYDFVSTQVNCIAPELFYVDDDLINVNNAFMAHTAIVGIHFSNADHFESILYGYGFVS